MLSGLGLLPLDLPALLQLGITALVLVLGLLFLLRNAASRYFVVDGGFGAESSGYDAHEDMTIRVEKCFVCGGPGTKKCARCKSVRYCSQECQAKHWKDEHKLKCKELNSQNISVSASSGGRRKNLGSSIALLPARGSCKMLEPKKILFPYDEFVKLFYWDKQTFPPCGLLNCGNSCFANVVLQCLACTRPLVAYLLEGGHKKSCHRNDWCFLCELQDHLKKVRESLKPFSPLTILSRLPKIGGNLGNGRQEDAHEFMRFAIDTMQSICLDEFGGEKALDASTQETTLIQHIFGGYLQSQVKCTKCDKISNRYENMMDLTVEIQGDAESLEDCLNQFTGKEWLDGENMYKCDGCNEYVKAWKRLTVHQPPNVLTIALKRFQGGRFGKLNKRVSFPETLDLRPYMSGEEDSSDLYTLYAVVVHIDMLNASFFGHYICYTKDFFGHWYRIDDCKVMKVDVEEVLGQVAYMLLYSRVNARQPSVKHPHKCNDEKSLEKATKSLINPSSTSIMEIQFGNEELHREAEDSDFNIPVKADVQFLVQGTGDGDSEMLHGMDIEKTQEAPGGGPARLGLYEHPDSNSYKSAGGHANSGSSLPEHKIGELHERNPSSLKKLEAEGNQAVDSADRQLLKENGSRMSLDDIQNDAAKKSINVSISAETNYSGPMSDASDITIENVEHSTFSSAEGQSLQGVLESLHIDFMNAEPGQYSSKPLTEKSLLVKEDMHMGNGCGHLYQNTTCNQRGSECEISIVKENGRPVGFFHNDVWDEVSNEKSQMGINGVDPHGSSCVAIMGKTQCSEYTSSAPDHCNGLSHKSEKLASVGSSESCFSVGLPNGYAQKSSSYGKSMTESSTVDASCKTLAGNDPLDLRLNCNGNQSGQFHESNKLSSIRNPKPLFSRGFLDHHSGSRSLDRKMQKQAGRTPSFKDKVNHIASSCPQP